MFIRDTEIPSLFIEKRIDITPTQFFVLLIVQHRRGCTISDLASELRVSKPSISNLTSRLVGLGFLERLEDLRDRRKVIVSVTRAGKEMIKRVDSSIERHVENQLSKLTKDEVDTFIRLLAKLMGNQI